MKLTVLAAEKSVKGLKTDKEPAYLLRVGDRNLLYGFGTGKTVLVNMRKLGLRSDFVETAFLPRATVGKKSGLGAFLNDNRRAQIYARINVFDGHYVRGLFGYKETGVDRKFARYRRIVRCKNYFLSPDKTFVAFSAEKASPSEKDGFFVKDEAGNYVPDNFSHELYLIVSEGKSRVLFCGGARTGLASVLSAAEQLSQRHFGGKLTAVVGGAGAEGALPAETEEVVRLLSERELPWYTDGASAKKLAALGGRVKILAAGDEIGL